MRAKDGVGGMLTIDDSAGTGHLSVIATSGLAANLVVVAGTGAVDNLTGGSGNDLFQMTTAQFHGAQNITGGAGNDTVSITDAAGLMIADGDLVNLHGIETIRLGGTGASSVTVSATADAEVGGAGHTLTLDDSAGTVALTLNATGLTANLVVDLASANFNAATHITGGLGNDTIALLDATGIVVNDAAFTNVTGIETLKIGGAADNAVTLGAKASADVGGVGHTFTLDDSAGLGGLMLDGSAMTADLKVLAGAGTDAIVGGAGNDTFFASLGNDIFTGGAGNNTFAFNSPNLGSDRITDFNNTTRADQIQVSAGGFGGGLAANQDVTSAFGTSANANFGSASERFHFDTANQTLYYSANGSGGTAIAIAQIEAGVTLHPHDIHVAA